MTSDVSRAILIGVALIPALTLVVSMVALYRQNRRRDGLYARLHRDHREIWKSLGEPVGVWWKPKGSWNAWPNYLPELFLSREEPAWLQEAPELRELLEECRARQRLLTRVMMPILVAGGVLFGAAIWWLG